MNMKKLLTAVGIASAMSVGIAQAQTLLTWDLSGAVAAPTLPSTTTAANLDTTSGLNELSRTGAVQAAGANAFASNTWNLTDTFIESDKYISFTLEASSGYEATFTSLQYAINGSNTAPNTGRWGYSIDGGAFVLQDPFTITFALPGSLATWDFADFTTDKDVEFRFWAYGSTSITNGTSATTGSVRVGNITGDDLVLNGSVAAIPEPSSLAFIGLAGMGLAGYVLRRRHRA